MKTMKSKVTVQEEMFPTHIPDREAVSRAQHSKSDPVKVKPAKGPCHAGTPRQHSWEPRAAVAAGSHTPLAAAQTGKHFRKCLASF